MPKTNLKHKPVTHVIQAERTQDHVEIDKVFKHEDIFPHLSDDFTSNPAQFDTENIVNNQTIFFIKVTVDAEIAGMAMYHPHNVILYEIHSAILPEHRGGYSAEMALSSFQWMFENTNCKKIITHIPEGNTAAYALARRAGMVLEGNNRKSIMKNGKLINQLILGITAEEV